VIDTPDTVGSGGAGGVVGSRVGGVRQAAAFSNQARARQRQGTRSTLADMSLKDTLLADYDHEMASTRRLLDRLIDDRLTWSPHPTSMSLAGLATHLSNIPTWSGPILASSSFDLSEVPPPLSPLTSRSAILTFFDRATATARLDMDRSDAEYAAFWSLKRGGVELFTMPRMAAFRTFVLHHTIHHRGQLSVYLRMLGIPVPAIYGPSADEA
jgi:uncharacterized damage-inducible protein DinB